MAIKHAVVKAPGQKLFAVADWNANHTFLQTDIDHNLITNTHNLTSDLQPAWGNVTGKPATFPPDIHGNAAHSSVFITGPEVPANETDPVYGAWIAGPPNVSEFTNDAGYLIAEADPVFTAWDKDHADLSNVTANQHHAQAHTLASHSTKDHVELTNVTSDQHHAQTHTIVSHDTTATGAELDTLTDNSMADALHRHSELSASDGTPDRALVVDAVGNVGIGTASPSVGWHIVGKNAKVEYGLGDEKLNETDFATHAKWDVLFDFDDTGGNATYLHAAGVGLLSQTNANMITPVVANTWYRLTYTVSAVTENGTLSSFIWTDTSDGAYFLDLTNGIHTLDFLSGAAPISFSIIATSDTGGDGFTLDDLSLKVRSGADLTVEGDITVDGNVGIGTTTPARKLDVRGEIYQQTLTDAFGILSVADSGGTVRIRYDMDGQDGKIRLRRNDDTWTVNLDSDGDSYFLGGDVGIGTATPTSPLHVVGLPIFANNAAAVAGGLTAGAFYRTGADPDPVCVVH